MIINFSIENFGSIKEKQTLSFEADKSNYLEDYYVIETDGLRLLKMALIYGANASGKTTILRALDFLRDLVLKPKEKKTEELDFHPFLFDEYTPKQNSILSIEFIHLHIRYSYEIEFFKKAIVRESLFFYAPKKANVFRRQTDIKNQLTEITFGSKIKTETISKKILEANTLWNNSVLGGFLKTNIELNELKEVKDWFEDFLSPMIGTQDKLTEFITHKIETSEIPKEMIISILKKADFNISDILINKEEEYSSEGVVLNTNVQFEHTVEQNSYTLPFELESQGTKRYYSFAGLLSFLIEKPVAFSVDELESSLHPDLYTHFILSFINNARQSQIVATTHNRELLNNKDIFRDDVIWITDKSQTIATELYSLSDFDTSVIRDTTNRLNVLKSGRLGGVPNLGDIYISLD